jgi:tRNA G10  N-methylase Trm11
MIQKGSTLISIPSKIRKQIISSIIEETNWSFNPLKAEIEYWFLIHNEKCALLGIKLSQIISTPSRKLKKGELRPKMAHILNLISEPNSNDIYLDPFAGYGALPWDRVNYFPYKNVYISEVDTKLCDDLDSLINNKKRITIQQSSALNLSYLSDKSVNKIVTDPPWGIHQMQNIDYENFYEDMLNEMIRITQSGGLLVILTAKLKEIENAIDSLSEGLSLLKT